MWFLERTWNQPGATGWQRHLASPVSCLGAQGGFTLLELLASIAVLLILTYVLFAAFLSTSDTVSRNAGKIEHNQAVRAVLDQITRDIERTVYLDSAVNMHQEGTGGYLIEPGIPTNTFYLLGDVKWPEPTLGSYVNIGYRIASTNVGGTTKFVLMRGDDAAVCTKTNECTSDASTNWWNYFNVSTDMTDLTTYNPGYWKVLSENVIGIQFQFYTNATLAGADQFTTVWDSTAIPSRLPYSVKVTILAIDTQWYNRAIQVDPTLTGQGTNIILDNVRSYSTRIFLPSSSQNP